MGLPHQEGYLRERKDGAVAGSLSEPQDHGASQGQPPPGRREDGGGDYGGKLTPKFFAFDEMTHPAFAPQPPFAPPDDLLRNIGSR